MASESGSIERAPHRPSSLPLNAPHPPRQTPPQLNHFANSLLDGVLRTVSSSEQGNEANSIDESNTKSELPLDLGKDHGSKK